MAVCARCGRKSNVLFVLPQMSSYCDCAHLLFIQLPERMESEALSCGLSKATTSLWQRRHRWEQVTRWSGKTSFVHMVLHYHSLCPQTGSDMQPRRDIIMLSICMTEQRLGRKIWSTTSLSMHETWRHSTPQEARHKICNENLCTWHILTQS